MHVRSHTHIHTAPLAFLLVSQKDYSLTYFPPTFFMSSRSFPKPLIPTLPLIRMTLIKHDDLITINLLCYVLHLC